MPSLREFIDRAISEYGAEKREPGEPLVGPRGQAKATYLIRQINGDDPKFAVIPDMKDEEILVPDTLRSLCKQLGIPLEDFGLILG